MSYGEIQNGVEVDVPMQSLQSSAESIAIMAESLIAPPPGAITINFDDAPQPCLFIDTIALRNEYSALGVMFNGPGALDGGAILDECGNFGVTGQSSPNFLAFNLATAAVLSDGGMPKGPETITFTNPVNYVQINAGSLYLEIVEMNAYDASNNLVSSDSKNITTDLQTLVVNGSGIVRVEISFTRSLLVLDDLAFVEEIEVSVDIKPGSCPNPINLKDKGVMPFAIMGTVEFDVAQIDPASIRLSREGVSEEVAPLSWSYDDVATTFEGELCDCHELTGDGFIDLALKVDAQEVINTLKLDEVAGETIPLTVTGKLYEEFGAPIRGEDCVRVLTPGLKGKGKK